MEDGGEALRKERREQQQRDAPPRDQRQVEPQGLRGPAVKLLTREIERGDVVSSSGAAYTALRSEEVRSRWSHTSTPTLLPCGCTTTDAPTGIAAALRGQQVPPEARGVGQLPPPRAQLLPPTARGGCTRAQP